MATARDRLVISRLVHRFTFGPKPGQFQRLLRGGVAHAPTALLRSPVHDPGLRGLREPSLSDLGPFPAAGSPTRAQFVRSLNQQADDLVLWWLDRMVLSDYPITERMTWFWHGHWATAIAKVRYPLAMKIQNETMRTYGLGNFADLSRAMVVDGALVYWLDGQLNVRSAPNENLGREFMELFTLGVGNYSEDDVKAAARGFTGYQVVRSSGTVSFQPARHDFSEITLLKTTSQFTAPVLSDYVVSLDANARFIAERLWYRFVSSISPAPASLATSFASRQVAPLVHAVATHPGLGDPANALVKSPVEWFVAVCRALSITPSKLPVSLGLINYLYQLGQAPFDPPNVGGWPADEAWLTTASAQARLAFAQNLVRHANLGPVHHAKGDRVHAMADWLGVATWSVRTTKALRAASSDAARMTVVAICAPEYVVSV